MVGKALFTSDSGEWETPIELFLTLDKEFRFELDPAATNQNALCNLWYAKDHNGLTQSWRELRTYVNPPYGRMVGLWTAKCVEESKKGALVVALLPARTDTMFWHRDIMQAYEIRFIRGRLKFRLNAEPVNTAPFPSVVVVWDHVRKLKWNITNPFISSMHIQSPIRA